MTRIHSYTCDACQRKRMGEPVMEIRKEIYSFGTLKDRDICSSCEVVIEAAITSCREAAQEDD